MPNLNHRNRTNGILAERYCGHATACALAGDISKRTLYRWEQEREFPRRRYLSKNHPIWKVSAILDWVESNATEDVA